MATRNFSSLKDTHIFLHLGLILLIFRTAHSVKCFCDNDICQESNRTCVLPNDDSRCFKSVDELSDGTYHVQHGCTGVEASHTFQCNSKIAPIEYKTIECCFKSDYCNKGLNPEFIKYTTTPDPNVVARQHRNRTVTLVTVCTLSVVVIGLVMVVLLRIRLRQQKKRFNDEEVAFIPEDESLRDLMDQSSGSGSGLPLLVQRTIAKQITLNYSVGKGRYGEVWKAQWRGENVAVKVFFTTEEASWCRETDLFQTCLLRHENVLGFIASDIKGTGSVTQLFLISEFHEHGSLHDYLLENCLTPWEMLKIVSSVINGLCHLHTEIHGTQGKPAMAHRDIKTKNILVKSNRTCCIADLGLAVKYNSETNEVDIAPNTRQGTKRYMAPEVLADTINTCNFDAFRKADMYAFALVLWEIARRTLSHGRAEDYQIPYYDQVANDPSFEEMKHVVYDRQIRPTVINKWYSDDYLKVLVKSMQECWITNPAARLTSLRVRKSIYKLIELHEMSVKPEDLRNV